MANTLVITVKFDKVSDADGNPDWVAIADMIEHQITTPLHDGYGIQYVLDGPLRDASGNEVGWLRLKTRP